MTDSSVGGDSKESKANAALDKDKRGKITTLECYDHPSGVDKLLRSQVDVPHADTCVTSIHDGDTGAEEQDLFFVSHYEPVWSPLDNTLT